MQKDEHLFNRMPFFIKKIGSVSEKRKHNGNARARAYDEKGAFKRQ